MTSPRDALRAIEAGAYNPPANAGAGDMDAQDEFRRFEIEQMNAAAAAESGKKLVTWGAVGLLLALVLFSNPPRRSR